MAARRLIVIMLVTAAMMSLAGVAHAYPGELDPSDWDSLPAMRTWMPDPEDPSTWITPDPTTDCWVCHGTQEADEPSGPHGGYLATTNKCATCHSVHTAPSNSVLMLPAATVKETCETCHDGTGGTGVYGALAAQGLTVGAAHRMVGTTSSTTNVIPGGDATSGGGLQTTFTGTGGNLTCTDCHSPHGAHVVASFTGDRARASVDTTVTSTRILRQRPTGATADVATYGSDWCGQCHAGRLSGSGVTGNHPVDSSVSQTQTAPFYYDNVVRVTSTLTTTTEMGTLGRNNFGYVMPDPRGGLQDGHYPICQQCHEDARSVGDEEPQQIYPVTEVYSVSATDGANAADNPRFQVFPHESQVARFLIESDDDLCLNCHGQPD